MKTAQPVDMGHNVWQIDLMEQGVPCRTASYVIVDEQVTVIETGSALSHDILLAGLEQLNVKPEDVAYLIVTHVHLDHAGGAGHFMEKAVNAKLVVHPRGGRHMANPEKLWAGAAQVYGERLGELFGSIKPVSEDRIIIKSHGETLDIGSRTLTFFDSPGHAKHHFTILDPVADGLYAGDAVGIRYRECFTGWNFEWVMPSTSPVDFDPIAVRNTIEMLQEVPFQWVYHAHFGKSPKDEACRETLRYAEGMADLIGQVYRPDASLDEIVAALRRWIVDDLHRQGHTPGANVEVLDIDVVLDAMGLMFYENKRLQG